jgi:hypothetical protein
MASLQMTVSLKRNGKEKYANQAKASVDHERCDKKKLQMPM